MTDSPQDFVTALEPRCSQRRCKHLIGPRGPSDAPYLACAAFPDSPGIPDSIAYGDDPHTTPHPGDHGIQYERAPD